MAIYTKNEVVDAGESDGHSKASTTMRALELLTWTRLVKSPAAMNAYYNNFVKSHRKIQDLAAFAMALNHTCYTLEGDDQRLYWNLQVKVTVEVYESPEFSEEEKMAFKRYLDQGHITPFSISVQNH